MSSVLVLLLAVAAATPSSGKYVGVLPLRDPEKALSASNLLALDETLRTASGNALTPRGYTVVDRANMILHIKQAGGDPTNCDTSCLAAIGQAISVQYLFSTSVVKTEGMLLLTVRLYETKNAEGKPLYGDEWQANSVDALRQEVARKVEPFFAAALPTAAAGAESKGTLVIQSTLAGAFVAIDGAIQQQPLGTGPASYDLPQGSHQVIVSHPGYLDVIRRVSIEPGQLVRLTARMVKDEPPPPPPPGAVTTLLTVTTNPPGAVVALDGQPLGKSGQTWPIAPGRHTVTATEDLYYQAEQVVNVPSGDNRSLPLTLQPNFGRLLVRTTTPGATVYLGDRQLGKAVPASDDPDGPSQLRQDEVLSGSYLLRVEAPDCHPARREIKVRDGKLTTVDFGALRPSVGSLEITTEPPGASIEIDGTPEGTSPVSVTRLAGGVHRVKATLPRYEPWIRTAFVQEGGQESLNFPLKPMFAAVSVVSEPAGARVTIDGTEVGTTPLRGLDLDEGTHQVQVAGTPGAYRPWKQSIMVIRRQPQTVNATLEEIRGRLVVMSKPAGAEVQLDGRDVGPAPQIFKSIIGGSHQVTLTLMGYQDVRQNVTVSDGQEKLVNVQLLQLLPAEAAAQRMAEYDRNTRGSRWAFYGGIGVTAAAAVTTLIELAVWSSDASDRDAAYTHYSNLVAAPEQVAAAWNDYAARAQTTASAGTRTAVFAGVTAVAAIGTAWLWWRIPAPPKFVVAPAATGSGVSLNATGTW